MSKEKKSDKTITIPIEVRHGWIGAKESLHTKPYPNGLIKCCYCKLELVQAEAMKTNLGNVVCPGRDRRKGLRDRRRPY